MSDGSDGDFDERPLLNDSLSAGSLYPVAPDTMPPFW
jgi:hypothetical protein